MNWAFRRELDENCTLLGYYAANITAMFSWNVGKKLPIIAVQ
jgi:hypothetical protein